MWVTRPAREKNTKHRVFWERGRVMQIERWLSSITFGKGTTRKRWLPRAVALLGVAALLAPLAQPLLPTANSTPRAEAADLGWTDVRPPLSDISDTATAPYATLPPFGDVAHPMAVTPDGNIFVAGGLPDPNRIYKSVDGGLSWRSSSAPCSPVISVRQSPGYSDPINSDNTILILCATSIGISRNGGVSWSGGPTTAASAQGEKNVSFAISPDFRGDKGGTVLIGTTGNSEVHSKYLTWDGAKSAFGPVTDMPEGAGAAGPVMDMPEDMGAAAGSALAVAFPPGFIGAILPEGSGAGAQGAAWSKPRNISNNSSSSFEPDVAVGPDGTAHVVWQECCPNSYEIFYATRSPGGAWSTPVNISQSGTSDNSPAIAVDPSGGVHVVWEQCCDYLYGLFYVTKPAGGQWSSRVKLPSYYRAYDPDIAVDGSGALHVVWRDDGYCNYATVYASKAPGGAWSGLTPLSSCTNTANPTIAAEKGGTVHVAWQDSSPGNWEIYHTTKPSGGSFGAPANVSNNNGTSLSPSIAVGGGDMHLVWTDYTSSGNGEILYSMHSGSGGFTSPRNISATTGSSQSPSLAVDGEGAPHVLWMDCCHTGGDWDVLYTVRSTLGIWSAPENISETSSYSESPSVAVGGGVVHGVWRDDTPGNPEIFHASAAVGVPSILLEPPTGKSGDTVTVKGRKFRASAEAAVSFAGAAVGTASVAVSPTSLVKISGDAQSGTVATALVNPFVVELRDNLGAPVAGATVAFTIESTPAGATMQDIDQATAGAQGSLLVPTSSTDPKGRAEAKLTLGEVAGSYTVRASSGGVPDANFTATANPGAATTLASVSGVAQNYQTAKVGTKLPAPFTATLQDLYGNAVPGKAVTFTIFSFPGSDTADTADDAKGQDIDKDTAGAQSTLAVTTDKDGNADATLTLGDTLGQYLVVAAIDLGGAAGTGDPGESVTFFARATSLQPTQVVKTASGDNQSGVVLTTLANPLLVTVKDATGLPVNGALVRFRISSIPPGATGQFIVAGITQAFNAISGADGTASVVLGVGNKTGTYLVSVRVGVGLGATFTATATAGAAASLVKSLGDSQTGLLTAPLPLPLVAAVRDAQGNGVPSASVTFTIATKPTGAAGHQLLASGVAAGAQTATITTNANGEAFVTLFLGNLKGDYTVDATSGTLTKVTFTASATDKITLPTPPSAPAPLPPPGGSFTATFTVPAAGNGTHVVEAVGKKTAGGAVSGDKAAALFSIGNLIRIYWQAGKRIEEQGTPLTGAWPAAGAAGPLLVASTPDIALGPLPDDGARIRLPSGATTLDNYWLALNLHAPKAPADVYRRVGGATPAFVDTNVGGANTSTRVTGIVVTGDFATGTVFAGVAEPEPRVYKSTDGTQTWAGFTALHQGRGAIGPGGVGLALRQKSGTDFDLYATTAGSKGGVHKSSDKGVTYSDTGLTNGTYNRINSLQSFLDGTTFAVAQNTQGLSTDTAVFRTTNFGPSAQWMRVDRRDNVGSVLPAVSSSTSAFPASAVVYARRSGVGSQQVLKSIDGGLTFAPTATDPGVVPIRTVFVFTNGTMVLAGSETGKVWRTTDGAATWAASTADLGGPVLTLDPSDDFALGATPAGALFASAPVAGSMEVQISTDGANTFSKVGSSAKAWGVGGSSLSLADVGSSATGYTLWAKPFGATDNDIFRAVVDPTKPDLATWAPFGTPNQIVGAGFGSMRISGVLASGIGEGIVMHLMGRPMGGGPINTVWRTYFPKTVTQATWSRQMLPGVPVDSIALPSSVSGDMSLDSLPASSTLGRMMVVRNLQVPTRIFEWKDTVDFLNAPTVTAPVTGTVFEQGQNIDLRWNRESLAVTYQFEVAKDANFDARVQTSSGNTSCPDFSSSNGGFFSTFDPLAPGTDGTTLTIPGWSLQAGVQYFWHVRVCGVDTGKGDKFARYYPGPWSANQTFTVALGPALTLTPNSGPVGTTVSYTAERMGPGDVVQITWDNPFKQVDAVSAGQDGKVTGSFAVPTGSPLGPHVVRANGAISFKSTAAVFTVVSATPAGAPTFTGKVALQALGNPGDARWLDYRLFVTLFPAGSATSIAKLAVGTDANGGFSAFLTDLPAGNYDIQVKGFHTLSNKKASVALPQASGAAAVDFGALKTGDLSSNETIAGDDYSILVTNFGQNGPAVVASANARLLSEAASVTMNLAADFERAEQDQIFTVEVRAQAGNQQVDAVDVFLDFNASILQLVDEEGNPTGRVAPGPGLSVVLQNQVDNEAGRIAFSAGRDPQAEGPEGDLLIAILRFKAVVPISGAALPMAFSNELPRLSGAYFNGEQLVRQ